MKDALIGREANASMWGVAFSYARPTALIEVSPAPSSGVDQSVVKERRIKIVNRNEQIEFILLIAALLLPIVLSAVAALLRPHRKNSQE